MTEKIKESSLKGPSLLFSYVPPPKIFLFVAPIHRSKGVRCTRRVISVVAKGAVQNVLRHFDHSFDPSASSGTAGSGNAGVGVERKEA